MGRASCAGYLKCYRPAVDFGDVLLLSVGLAMDATAASATRGLLVARVGLRHVACVALLFGGFQALMPLVGWQLGVRVGDALEAWDHWIAFSLLLLIGGKTIWDGLSTEPPERNNNPFGMLPMLILAIATSIDALAVGVTLPMLEVPLWPSIATIGATTACLSALGLFAGRRFGQRLGSRLDLLGGAVLVGLGVKILIEHTI